MNYLEFARKKIIDRPYLDQVLALWKFKQYRIVFTNGCFDILHAGHADYLSKAKQLGDILVIGLNTDASVRRIKGANRPVNSEDVRAFMLASLTFVDAVVLFDEDTPYRLIDAVKPHILVKGSDYRPEDIVGADIVINNGGQVVTLDLLEGYSTTVLIEKLTGKF